MPHRCAYCHEPGFIFPWRKSYWHPLCWLRYARLIARMLDPLRAKE